MLSQYKYYDVTVVRRQGPDLLAAGPPVRHLREQGPVVLDQLEHVLHQRHQQEPHRRPGEGQDHPERPHGRAGVLCRATKARF